MKVDGTVTGVSSMNPPQLAWRWTSPTWLPWSPLTLPPPDWERRPELKFPGQKTELELAHGSGDRACYIYTPSWRSRTAAAAGTPWI